MSYTAYRNCDFCQGYNRATDKIDIGAIQAGVFYGFTAIICPFCADLSRAEKKSKSRAPDGTFLL
jgi:hypothetical protein